jgi:hypothetical protein
MRFADSGFLRGWRFSPVDADANHTAVEEDRHLQLSEARYTRK